MTTATLARPRLRARHPQLDFGATPKYWVLGDPQTTHSLNILNFGIPTGERWFIDGVRLAIPYIADQRLLADARGFIGQETTHARMHERAAEHLRLFDNPRIRRAVELSDSRRTRLYERVDSLPEPLRRQAVQWWLSGVMLGEHFTALFADLIFDTSKADATAFDPEMLQLLKWHAAEELEHRTLPFDVFEHIGGRYLTRIAVALPAFVLIPIGLFQLTDLLMRQDPDLRHGFSIRDHIAAIRAHRSPSALDVLPRLVPYLHPKHHPSKICNDRRARAFLASNPPAGGKDR